MTIEQIALETAFKVGFKALSDAVSSNLSKIFHMTCAVFEKEYGQHLLYTFQKCSHVRTILNRDRPVPLRDIYVGLQFESGDEIADDYDLIERIREYRKILITGTGGGGKTIFMKYLWISLFENPQGKIPVFIELRRFNGVTTESFLSFLFRSINSSVQFDEQKFEHAVRSGAFCFMFDGFDEINDESRDAAEKAILDLSEKSSDTIFVISSRNDERFDGWTLFERHNVLPMDLERTCALISKLDFDSKIKRKFIERIKKDLFEKHESFLSSPLLATMMLLTFDQFADIPEKVHIFYEQAFDTLFAKHDATKEAFKRKSYSQIPIDSFKEILSLVCLISYYSFDYDFSESELLSYVNKAKQISAKEFNSNHFVKDVIENVCVLQRDGLRIIFSHRSFQEFFCAYALINIVPNKMQELTPRIFTQRAYDNILSMCMDMNTELIERELIYPCVSRLVSRIDGINKSDVLEKYLYATSSVIMCRFVSQRRLEMFLLSDDSDLNVSRRFLKQYNKPYDMNISAREKYQAKNCSVLRKIAKDRGIKIPSFVSMRDSYSAYNQIVLYFDNKDADDVAHFSSISIKISMNEIQETIVPTLIESLYRSFFTLSTMLNAKIKRRNKTIDEIFRS